jgi:hypothetical protein
LGLAQGRGAPYGIEGFLGGIVDKPARWGGFEIRFYRDFADCTATWTKNLPIEERHMENDLKKLDIDNLPLPKLVEELRRAAKNCQCEGTRETVFVSRGRDNVVPCLACEPIYQVLEPLQTALKLLRPE